MRKVSLPFNFIWLDQQTGLEWQFYLSEYQLHASGARSICKEKNMDLPTITEIRNGYPRLGQLVRQLGWINDYQNKVFATRYEETIATAYLKLGEFTWASNDSLLDLYACIR